MRTLLLILLFLPIFLYAQEPQKYLIKAGKLFESESGTFKTGYYILTNGKRIESVKTEKEVTAKERQDYKLVDLSAYTVLPGLIDCHTHLLFNEILYPRDVNKLPGLDMARTLTFDGDAYRAIYGAARAKAYLEAGITTVQDLGNSGQFADIALRRAIAEGLVPGSRMLCSGPGLAPPGGQIPGVLYKHQGLINDEYRIVKGPEDAAQAVRENVNQGVDVIKIFSDNMPARTMLSIEEIKAIVQEAHRYGLRVTAHAVNNQSVYNAVMGGVDGIEHGYTIHDTTLELMAKKNVILVPTDGDTSSTYKYISLSFPDLDKKNDSLMRKNWTAQFTDPNNRLLRAIKKGVMIAAGSDDYLDLKLPYAIPSKLNLAGYAQVGVPVNKVLQFATINAAQQINRKGRLGEIKKGYAADIIALDNSIENDIQALFKVHFVMKDGQIYVEKGSF